MKALKIATLALSIIALASCSAFRSKTQPVSISCVPAGATLMVNGSQVNNPAQINLPRDRSFNVRCSKPGYYPSERTIVRHFNETGVLDAVGTVFLLVPAVGLFTPGAWSLDETDIHIQLAKEES